MGEKTAGGDFRNDDLTTIHDDGVPENPGRRLSVERLRAILHVDPERKFSGFPENRTVGLGGIGTVFAVRDPVLNRMVALKVLRPSYRHDSKFIDSLVREARTTAQIDHPNVVPVHQLGVLDDAGIYFSMKLVEGENLRSVLEHLEAGDREYLRKYTLNQLLDIFVAVCNAVSFAHSKGILHRDLKPSNIMLGSFGEVLVMDWGMAKYRAEKDSAEGGQKINLASEISGAVDESVKTQFDTHDGALHGTPAFMAPEQALGQTGMIDERTDIYSLGTILYSILTWRKSPFDPALPVDDILRLCAAGDFLPPRKRSPERNIPVELEAICLKAMAYGKDDRYGSVIELIDDVRNYRDVLPVAAYSSKRGYRFLKYCQRRPMLRFSVLVVFFTVMAAAVILAAVANWRGTPLLEVADRHAAAGDAAMDRAMQLVEDRKEELANYESGAAGYERFRRIQSAIDESVNEAGSRYAVALDLLSQLEGSGGPHVPLNARRVEIFARQLEYMLEVRDYDGARKLMQQMRERHENLAGVMEVKFPELMQKVGEVVSASGYMRLTAGDAEIAVKKAASSPCGTPELLAAGRGIAAGLPAGEYLVEVTAGDGRRAVFPLLLDPGEVVEKNLELPPRIPAGTVFVPGGDFKIGFDVAPGIFAEAERPGFFIGEKEVTFDEYREFFDSLSDEKMKRQFMPLYIFSLEERALEPIFGPDGAPRPPFSGDMPVIGITAAAAAAYCDWYAGRYGVRCRLPDLREWEKAARGVDGRNYPWGNEFNRNYALFSESPELEKFPNGAPGGSFPADRSVYGAFDMAGNVREFCLPLREAAPAADLVKGGSVNTGRFSMMCAATGYSYGSDSDVGFRILIEL